MTSKPISTISYNSELFLKEKLERWYSDHLIQAYQYIKHTGEDGDKDHIHLRIEPNKQLDPMILQEQLREFVPGNDKPLGCRPFRPAKEEDWYLYVVHDHDYLLIKYGGGQAGEKLPYNYTDIIISEFYDLEVAWIRARAYLAHSSANISKSILNGKKPINLVLEGENVHTVNAIVKALQENDYCNLQRKYLDLDLEYEELLELLKKYDIEIIEENKEKKLIAHNIAKLVIK